MTSPFNLHSGEWEIAWPGRISRHDLVYGSPPEDPLQGIPLGNGDLGALVWCDASTLIFAINKCDLWDDAEFTRFHNWKAEEEEFSTTLRHACRLIPDFRMPVFDLFYRSEFETAVNTAKLFGLASMGWDPLPIVLARLGLSAELELQPGERALFTPDARTRNEWETVPVCPEANATCKVDATGTARLGLPRLF